ncbi:MAG: hypothetical protein DLM69_01060 [Candidatus Chloroheliales bacterium]|nr:MAG: hypothetical protein DLM69_01060 [Chloroflexota bacterium]
MDLLSGIQSSPKRMLVVVAHPGEETFPLGALIDRYSKYAVLVGLICLTRGTSDPQLARSRETELRKAARTIGVSQLYLWSFKSPLAEADNNELTARVVQIIRLLQPQVVVALSPGADADVTTVARVVASAVPAAADEHRFSEHLAKGLPLHQVKKLYYLTSPLPPDDAEAQDEYYPPTTVIQVAHSVRAQRGAWAEYLSRAADIPAFEQSLAEQAGKAYLHLLQGTPSRRAGQPFEEDLFAGV